MSSLAGDFFHCFHCQVLPPSCWNMSCHCLADSVAQQLLALSSRGDNTWDLRDFDVHHQTTCVYTWHRLHLSAFIWPAGRMQPPTRMHSNVTLHIIGLCSFLLERALPIYIYICMSMYGNVCISMYGKLCLLND